MTCSCKLKGKALRAPKRYSLAALKRRRTITQGHTDNLKVESGCHRVWLSRMTTADGAPYNHQVTVERCLGGRWRIAQQYRAR